MIMPRLKQKLLSLFKDAARIAIVGIGSELRADDAVGLLVLKHLRPKISKIKNRRIACRLFNGGPAPENLTGEIRRFKPGHLIMIDAVDMAKKPGTIALLDLKRIKSTVFLTHKLPIKLMLDYLAAEMTFTTIFLGIQPKSLDFGAPVSKEVIRAGRDLADWLGAALKQDSEA
ncbi:MAG: hydrogenase 3 maturation endopeptidase HyCI [Kiritimatiellia bacterium]|nr:hydrogenase 3 maturation endopeptidase HyCI [Kiritimatiellia bacterium]